MRVMTMHKTNPRAEAGELPPPEVMAGMGPLVETMMRDGVFVSAEGLQPSFTGVRLQFKDGECQVTRGPFVGNNELMAGFCMLKTHTIDEAVAWARRFAEVAGDAEIDIRPITEMWDMGFCPRPEGETRTRYMLIRKADAASEAGQLPGRPMLAQLAALHEEMVAAGVFLSAEGLQPSAKGLRLQFSGGQHRVMDGPFTESKELIAGFCIVNVASIEEAVARTAPFGRLIGDVEIDVRVMLDVSELV